ncbi:MAG: hypothetical protein M1825_003557 [Sarcosagium campestre]|nr:MAG: hypothetical protein M1825_003557 [Sarcosagium campestre]
MSPSFDNNVTDTSTDGSQDAPLNLQILGIGIEYPPYQFRPEDLDTLANRFYPPSAALSKVLMINRFTGIETRSAIGTIDHPIVNQPNAPSIAELCKLFLTEGVALSVAACRKAIKEWGGSVNDITHVVSTSCTNSANPGFDHFVVKQLGLRSGVEKVLLHGVGCSGGLAALRTAANLAMGASFRGRPARVLVLACEISSVLVRSELDSVAKDQDTRIGLTLFSDCASALVLSNGIGGDARARPIYELQGWKHEVLDDSETDLGFDVDPLGWKVVLSPRVPEFASAAVKPVFTELIKSITDFDDEENQNHAEDFDWALHPGGSTIITGVQDAMKISPSHLRASYDVYINHGNSSSATIISVMHKLREMGEGREKVVACAFGPGIAIEMMILKRLTGVGAPPTDMYT